MAIYIKMFMNQLRGLWEFCGLKFRFQSNGNRHALRNRVHHHLHLTRCWKVRPIMTGKLTCSPTTVGFIYGDSKMTKWPGYFRPWRRNGPNSICTSPVVKFHVRHWCLAPVHLALRLVLKRLRFAQFSIRFNLKVVFYIRGSYDVYMTLLTCS